MAVLRFGLRLWRSVFTVLQFLPMLVISLLLGLYVAFKFAERQSMIDSLPAIIEPGRVVLIGGESGFREGCGAAIFTLNAETARQLQKGGLQFLQQAQQARGKTSEYYPYGLWKQTPQFRAVDEVLGLSCADPDDELERRIYRAMVQPGSFYANKPEGMLMVLPAEDLIVFIYEG